MTSFVKNIIAKKLFLSIFSAVFLISLAIVFPSIFNRGVPIYDDGPKKGLLVDGKFMELFIKDHNEHPVFYIRKFTNVPVFTLEKFTNLSLSASFILVQFIYISLTIYTLLTLTEYLYKKRFNYSLSSLIFFLLSFSIFFAFFIPIYTYDDFPQYLFLWLAFLFGLKKKYFILTIFLSLSLLTRESSIFIFPSIAILLFPEIVENPKKFFTHKKELLRTITIFVIPAIVFYFYILLQNILHSDILQKNLNYLEEERFTHLTFNFHNLQYGIESFVVIALVFLSTVYILKFSKSFQNDRQKNTYKTAWLLAFIINTPVTLLATRAQEARIMALPLVLIWPYIGKYIFELLKEFESQTKDYLQKWKKTNNIPLLLINLLSVISILALCYLFILKVYTPGLNGFHRGYKIYALITVSILSIHYLIIKKQN